MNLQYTNFVVLRFCKIVGLLSIVTNFNQSKDAVSGPLAIVAAGADIARNDAASLMQFAAIVNVNLAMVNALPLPVSHNPLLKKKFVLKKDG